MNKPSQFYTQQRDQYKAALQHIKSQLNISSLIRLFVFLVLCLGVYLSWGNTLLILGIITVGIICFLLLVSRHSKLQYQRDLHQALIDLCKTELQVLTRDFHELPSGENFRNPNHYYSHDIDLFGRGSFYQYLNRTALASGSAKLASLLQANDIQDVVNKQQAIQELSGLGSWRLHFAAMARLVKTEVSATSVQQWLANYIAFAPKNIQWVSRLFSIGSLLMITLYFTDIIAGWILFGWFSLGLAITGKYLKKINTLSTHTVSYTHLTLPTKA